IEIMEQDRMAIHHDVAATVDKMLRGVPPRPEIRERSADGEIEVVQLADTSAAPESWEAGSGGRGRGAVLPRPGRSELPVSRPMSGDGAPVLGAERVEGPRNGPQARVQQTIRIYPYGVSRSRLEKAIRELKVAAMITKTWDDANAIIALKAHYRRE